MKKIRSTQMSVRTQFNALDERLEIVASGGSLTQWYNANASPQWKPNRLTNNLLLKVSLVATDVDSKQRYTPAISNVTWYYVTYVVVDNESKEVLNACSSATADYTVSGQNLYVKKNVSPTGDGLVILARVTYTDPRSGEAVTIDKRATLVCEQDSSQRYDVFINAPKIVRFDPIADYDPGTPTSSRITVTASATFGEQPADASLIEFRWYAKDKSVSADTLIDAVDSSQSDSTHVPVNVFPCYVSGQGTATLTLDAMCCDELALTCRLRLRSTGALLPCTDTVTVAWQVLPIDPVVYSRNGTAVRSNSVDKTFGLLVNVKGGATMTDAQVREHLVVQWSRRNGVGTSAASESYVSLGYGPEVTVPIATLKSTYNVSNATRYDSKVVKADLSLMGPYVPVVAYDSYRITYDSTGKIVTGITGVGTQKVVTDGTTGKIVVSRN